jgi:hypothetical protein
MDSELINVKNILLAEDDPGDVELTLAALAESHLAKKVGRGERERGAGLSLSSGKIYNARGRQSYRRVARQQDAKG